MSILNEFKDFKKDWKKSSLLLKVILVLFLFLTVSSVASLSDRIFEWKGFILDGIAFYKKYIASPIKMVLETLGLTISLNSVDTLIVGNLFIIPLLVAQYKQDGNIKKAFFPNLIEGFKSIMTLIFLTIAIYITAIKVIGYPIILFILFIIAIIAISFYNRTYAFLRVYIPILIGLFLVLIFAAINSGLTR